MTAFTHGEIAAIRLALKDGMKMHVLCAVHRGRHTRDELVEAIDSIRREPFDLYAMRRTNLVLSLQAAGHPLINGNPQGSVARAWQNSHPMPRPMF